MPPGEAKDLRRALPRGEFAHYFKRSVFPDRNHDADAKLVITADYAPRGGRKTPLKSNTDAALLHVIHDPKVLMVRRTREQTTWVDGRDFDYAVMTGFTALEGNEHMSAEEIEAKIQETFDLGGNQILLQGGLHPEYRLEWYEEMLADIKRDFPQVNVHGFSPPEIHHFTKLNRLSLEEVLTRLRDAGLGSIRAVKEAMPDFIERLDAKTPMGRMGLPHELKGIAVLLASEAAAERLGLKRSTLQSRMKKLGIRRPTA